MYTVREAEIANLWVFAIPISAIKGGDAHTMLPRSTSTRLILRYASVFTFLALTAGLSHAGIIVAVGNLSGGGTVTQNLTLTDTWTNFTFTGFTDVVSVDFSSGTGFPDPALDNINGVVTFEGVVLPTDSLLPATPYTEAGFTLTNLSGVLGTDGIFGAASGTNSNGTATFAFCGSCNNGGSVVIELAMSGGAPFSLDSIDAANFEAVGAGAAPEPASFLLVMVPVFLAAASRRLKLRA